MEIRSCAWSLFFISEASEVESKNSDDRGGGELRKRWWSRLENGAGYGACMMAGAGTGERSCQLG